jgi:hypothetical protein
LYPYSYSSLPHPFNPYTGGIMYMPNRLKKVIKNLDEALQVINEKKEIFSVKIKGHIDNNF